MKAHLCVIMKKDVLFLLDYLFVFILLFSGVLVFAQTDSLLTKADIPPLFEGCDDLLISAKQRQECSNPKIQAFIHQNIRYPDSARVNGTEGVVVVRFKVDTTGKVRQIELLRNIGSGCGLEANRVVQKMPPFKPALRNGAPIETSITLPIRFKRIDEARPNNNNLYQLHWGTIYEDYTSIKQLRRMLYKPLSVRDYYGNTYPIKYFTLQHRTGQKSTSLETKGASLTKKMKQLIKRAKRQHKIIFKAVIDKNFEEIKVERALLIANVALH